MTRNDVIEILKQLKEDLNKKSFYSMEFCDSVQCIDIERIISSYIEKIGYVESQKERKDRWKEEAKLRREELLKRIGIK